MQKRIKQLFSFIVLFSVLLAACTAPSAATQAPVETQAPAETAAPVATEPPDCHGTARCAHRSRARAARSRCGGPPRPGYNHFDQ